MVAGRSPLYMKEEIVSWRSRSTGLTALFKREKYCSNVYTMYIHALLCFSPKPIFTRYCNSKKISPTIEVSTTPWPISYVVKIPGYRLYAADIVTVKWSWEICWILAGNGIFPVDVKQAVGPWYLWVVSSWVLSCVPDQWGWMSEITVVRGNRLLMPDK